MPRDDALMLAAAGHAITESYFDDCVVAIRRRTCSTSSLTGFDETRIARTRADAFRGQCKLSGTDMTSLRITNAVSDQLESICRRAWLVLGLTAMGQALGTYAGSTMNVAFPAVQDTFDVSRSTLAWALSGYSIASASLLLLAGRLADRISGRRVFLTGVALFGLTCALAAISPTSTWLIIARTGQGFSTALMVPSSLALALRKFPASRMSMGVGDLGRLGCDLGCVLGAAFGRSC